jgi:hypothetical protein
VKINKERIPESIMKYDPAVTEDLSPNIKPIRVIKSR